MGKFNRRQIGDIFFYQETIFYSSHMKCLILFSGKKKKKKKIKMSADEIFRSMPGVNHM